MAASDRKLLNLRRLTDLDLSVMGINDQALATLRFILAQRVFRFAGIRRDEINDSGQHSSSLNLRSVVRNEFKRLELSSFRYAQERSMMASFGRSEISR